MDDAGFWAVIEHLDRTQVDDDTAIRRPAVQALSVLPAAEIVAFEEILTRKLYDIDTREHARSCYRGQADPHNGDDYISVDDFLYARCGVVASGRTLYETVLAHASQFPTDLHFECLLSLADEAYQEKTGETLITDFPISYESFSNSAGWEPGPTPFSDGSPGGSVEPRAGRKLRAVDRKTPSS